MRRTGTPRSNGWIGIGWLFIGGWLAAGLAAPLAASAASVVIVPASANVNCGLHDDPLFGLIRQSSSGPTSETLTCTSQGTSTGSAILGGTGLASANALGVGMDALGEVFSGVAVVQTGTPPEDPGFIGFQLEFTWSVLLSGASGASVRASFLSPNGTGGFSSFSLLNFSQGHADGDPPIGMGPTTLIRTELIRSDVVYAFAMRAACSVGAAPTTPGRCAASIDPVFRFDQAALDARLGAHSFLLDDYYDIVTSENFGAPVPEPDTASLALLGLLALTIARWRARRAFARERADELG